MDYEQLRRLYEQWHGQVCSSARGPIIDTVEEEGVTYLIIMNVGSDAEPQLVVLENRSSVADVTSPRLPMPPTPTSGRYMYQAEYYPLLITRYMDLSGAVAPGPFPKGRLRAVARASLPFRRALCNIISIFPVFPLTEPPASAMITI